ncbi:MAG: ribonuclease P protein component [Alphaproteobacteria bacterium]|nr:ribonuclease P protein component [Alphaproteobacteria bacterium]
MKASRAVCRSLETLCKRREFLAVQGAGRKWVSHGLILQTRPNETGAKRIGFTVSKKVHKSAVKRNRIKRRLRAAAADVLGLCGQAGHDYVLVGRPQTATRAYETLCEDLRWCLRRLDLYDGETRPPEDKTPS